MQLILATRNSHKTREFVQILGATFVVTDLSACEKIPAVEETGKSFEENATLKAVVVSRFTDGFVIADDSGLEVIALGGAPGIFSARYAGEQARDADNVAKLLRELGDETDRRARFRCVIAMARAGERRAIFHGSVDGQIALTPRGENGFGYDPIFVPIGFARTFAELGDEVKNRISHRARAIAELREYLLKPNG